MRRPRDVALRAGFYLAAALSGIAAAYVFNEWVLPYWAPPRHDGIDPQDGPSKSQDVVPQPPTLAKDDAKDDVDKTLSPLQTQSLPLPPPAPALLSGSYLSVESDTMTSSTSSLHTSAGEESLDERSQSNTSDTEPFVDLLSPPPPHVITRRRSVRIHDMFAESHISFSDLGNLVAPQGDPE